MTQTTYADSGVNIELGDDVSKILYNAAKATWVNRQGKLGEVIMPFDDFSGVRAIDVSNLPKGTLMNIGFDGVGTKVEIAERANNHRTIAYDLFAMVCDDAVVRGAEPVLVGSILDVKSLGNSSNSSIELVRQLAEGYINAAREANVAIVNGEVAELGTRVGGHGDFNYNWGAGVVWFANKDKMFTGNEIKPGDYLIGLKETGFRSNGLSLVRKIMKNEFGEDWHLKCSENTLSDILRPSKIYSSAVADIFGGYAGEPKTELHGVAHITGGGIPGKLGRVLKPSGLGAFIDDPFYPSFTMRRIQKWGNVSDSEAYKSWNMGQGMILISPKPEEVISILDDHQITAKVIGNVIKKPEIVIQNKGVFSSGEYIHF